MDSAGEEKKNRIRQQVAAATRRWYARYLEENRARARANYRKHREQRLAGVKAYQAKNRDARTEYYHAWRNSEHGKAVRTNAEYRRRARKRGGSGTATNQDVEALLAMAAHCAYCKVEFSDQMIPTLDHIIPLAKGGAHSNDNLAAACGLCNSRKGTRTAGEFMAELSAENFA